MPSFTFMKSPRRQSEQIERHESGVSLENDNKEGRDVVQQRSSKRNFFRSLLKRSSTSSETRAGRRRSVQYSVWKLVFNDDRSILEKLLLFAVLLTARIALAQPSLSELTSDVSHEQATPATSPTRRRARTHPSCCKKSHQAQKDNDPSLPSRYTEDILWSSPVLCKIRGSPYRRTSPLCGFSVGLGTTNTGLV